MKGLYKLEVIKDYKNSGLKKGDIVWCYGIHWFVDLQRMFELANNPAVEDKEDFLDKLFFLIWLPDRGWLFIERCHVKPMGAKLDLPGIC